MQFKLTCPFLTQQPEISSWLVPWLTPNFTQLEVVAGDASFRSYYRLLAKDNTFNKNILLMYAPPAKESLATFINLAVSWQQQGIKVPQVLASNLPLGVALLEDLGNLQFMQQVKNLSPAAASPYYQQAISSLLGLQQLSPKGLPSYTSQLLTDEINLFSDWFLPLLEVPATSLPSQWPAFCQQLVASALNQPQVLVHRDYHSRNLMLLDTTNPAASELGIIDFQDAVLGPCTYDLVSLTKDCYLNWPKDHQDDWFSFFYQGFSQQVAAQNSSALPSKDSLYNSYQLMGMQRHIKVLGIFARLYLRDNKSGYLADLPLTLEHLMQATQLYPEFNWLTAWLAEVIQPKLAKRLPQLFAQIQLKQNND